MSAAPRNSHASDEALSPGFQTPALDAQAVFRTVLEAWSRPGSIASVEGRVIPPRGLDAASAAIALTLIDIDTPVWLSDACTPAAPWLRFHCNCPLVSEAKQARFAFATTGDPLRLNDFDIGTSLSPELGATVILATESLETGAALTLSGPGIRHPLAIRPAGLPDGLLAEREALRPAYPAGVDLILTCGERFACLPRTTFISKEA